MKNWKAFSAAALALALMACGAEEKKEAIVAAPVVVARAAVSDVEDRIGGTGELAAPDRAAIAAEVDGRITEVRVDEGSKVVVLGVQKLDPAQKVRVVSSLSF